MNTTTFINTLSEAGSPLSNVVLKDQVEKNLPADLIAILRKANRVILVANNPAIGADDFKALAIGVEDVVVSFNTCVKSEYLSPEPTNVFVHGYHAQEFHFFGLPYDPAVTQLLCTTGARCFTILVGAVRPMSALPNVAIFADRIPLPPLQRDYPVLRKNGKPLAGPSTGFNAMVVFDHIRQLSGYHFTLVALGFSDEAGKLWRGYAWEYERAWLSQSSIQRIALVKPRRSWRRWLFK